MKKILYLFSVCLLLGFASCSNEDDFYANVPSVNSASTRAVSGVTHPAINSVTTLSLSESLLNNGVSTTGGVYWANTYTDGAYVVSDIFTFSHSSMYSGYAYWDGFTVSNANDITNYGTSGSSDGWVSHQWSCMPGSGVNTAGTVTPGTPGQSGDPFLVAYWSSYMDPKNPSGTTFSESTYSNWIKIGSLGKYIVTGLKIANHPWPYYGNLGGDGFARPLSQTGDFFNLYIYGVNENNIVTTNKVTVSLAKNTSGGINNLVQSAGWITVSATDLARLGNVKYLIFQMDSSDADPTWGINTAAYFCLDKLQVKRTS